MILILNEKELLRKSLEEGYIDNDKTSNTIRILAKYYFSIDMSKKQVYDSINKFFIVNYRKYNAVKWQKTFDRIIDKVCKDKDYNLLNINNIEITKAELDKIKKIDNIKFEKIAFVLLVYAKIYNQMNNKDSDWVNIDQKYIFSDAKIKESIYNQGIILHIFEELGLITPTKIVDHTNIKVNYIDKNSPIELVISDFRNFVYEYLKWKGKNIINCEKCGILFYSKNNSHKFCEICQKDNWRKYNAEKQREYRMRV
jgi:hypothetical protein